MQYKKTKLFFLTLFLFFIPSIAHADMGLPVIFVTLPLMIVAFIPVVAIEAIVYKNMLKADYPNAIWGSFYSNIISTVLGVPFSWFILLKTQMAIDGGRARLPLAWIGESRTDLVIALFAGLFASYFMSVLIEYFAVKSSFKSTDKKKLKKSVWIANLYSYLFIILVVIIYMFFKIFK